MRNYISIFGLEIHFYALCILTGVVVAYFIAAKLAKKMDIDKDFILDGVIYCLPLAIIGARIYYVIFEWDNYKDNLMDVFKIWQGGLAIHGGIITAIVFILIYCKVKKVDVWKVFDIVFPAFLVAQVIGRWGNFYNAEAHGDIMSQSLTNFLMFVFPDALIERTFLVYGSYYHPTFLYEGIWNMLGFLIIVFIRRYKFFEKGDSLPFYMIWYGIGRFFIEGLRTDALMVRLFGHLIRQNQLISIVLIIVGIILIVIKRLGKNKEPFIYTIKEEYEDAPLLKDMIKND